jgi:hypothetical protein
MSLLELTGCPCRRRSYIETCLLKCYRFITAEEDLPDIVARLSKTVRGIGDPMVAAYARCYLSLMASQVIHGSVNRTAVVSGIRDFLFSFKDVTSEHRLSVLESKNLSVAGYLHIMSPAVGWLFQLAARGATKELFTDLFAEYLDNCKSAMVLRHIVDAFDPSFYVPHIGKMCEFAKEASSSGTSQLAEVYAALGSGCVKVGPPASEKLKFLNEAWKTITKVEAIDTYLSCATVFVELILKYYSPKELGIVLKDIVAHAKRATATPVDGSAAGVLPSGCLASLEKIMTLLVQQGSGDLNAALTSDEFLVLLDMFHGERKLSFCKSMLKSYVDNVKVSSDAMLINTCVGLGVFFPFCLDALVSCGCDAGCLTLAKRCTTASIRCRWRTRSVKWPTWCVVSSARWVAWHCEGVVVSAHGIATHRLTLAGMSSNTCPRWWTAEGPSLIWTPSRTRWCWRA